MLQVKDVTYAIGERQLLAGIDWVIHPGKRVALIGPNGAGKTTILRILTGEIAEYHGSIIKPKSYQIGYLPQEEAAVEDDSILHTVLQGRQEVIELEARLADLHEALNAPHADHDALLEEVGEVEHRYDALEGYQVEAAAKSILAGLGFAESDFERPLSEFSGGWRMRVHLARLLLQNPDLLLLDEPTNHLDIPSLEWLEKYLLNFAGSIVVVSHDRFFIDRLADSIYELDRGKLEYYAGNYHVYEREKAQRLELLRKKWEEQQAERERQMRFINRFRYKATKAKQVQSRVKQLEKMEEIELPPPPRRLNFEISVDVPSYKDVLHIRDLSFRYDQEWVLEHIDLSVYRGEKLALVGVNGAGKTTLTRLIAGELTPQRGSLKIGERVSIGYYAQHQVDALNLEATVYEEVMATAADSQVPHVRDVLGMFQFRGDDIYKPIEVLSGGEKARVSLTKILLSPVNFLIMDEPTNHLDVISKDALEHALMHYDGTLILISHDRYFLDKLVHRVIELDRKQITEYAGNYSYYLQKRDAEPEFSVRRDEEKPRAGADGSVAKKSKEQKRLEAEARQSISKDRNRLTKTIASLEQQIERWETKKEELEFSLSLPETYDDSDRIIDLQKEYASLTKTLEEHYHRWEAAQLELEALVSQVV
ncbi:ATP-binding cassette domain-containing protein [candidate division KSB3 bacterium]|uniref:ATP-binding cassette domain-containing protein n=1 Tax=candidate division KSB3 bacterium TaxID=2044937 RepID=A0A9D5JZC7_9BACT|nr:ATP-binding cassette domain-containing protein [candidate division KSB3 bacterium]MBD3326561.1 ATP-binding cassette domain-containing protein [candidate division KSB3 bacterium]